MSVSVSQLYKVSYFPITIVFMLKRAVLLQALKCLWYYLKQIVFDIILNKSVKICRSLKFLGNTKMPLSFLFCCYAHDICSLANPQQCLSKRSILS